MAREELRSTSRYDYAIVNDDLENCVASLKAVIRAARSRTSRLDADARRILDTFEQTEDRKEG